MVDERILAERLISYDTSRAEELVAAAGFVKGWLESRDIEVQHHDHHGLPVLVAEVGPARRDAPCVVLHGHLDVVPARPEQFQPRVEDDKLIGRGAYDMKGGLAGMMCALKDAERQDRVRVRLICVPDEESEELDERATEVAVQRGLGGDFAITGEPTDMHIGVEAKGVLAMRDRGPRPRRPQFDPVAGRQRRAQGRRRVPRDRVAAVQPHSSEMFDRPSINLGRIHGGDAINKVPDECTMAVDVRYLPGRTRARSSTRCARSPGST